ncbi:MAG: phage major capsid protein [Chloroflexi bacterium]|nr:phage major capsid protein [Chloroflexota bacterium]
MESKAKELYAAALKAVEAGKAILDEFDGKEMPAEKSVEVDRHFDEASQKRSEADRLEKAAELISSLSAPLEEKRLPGMQASGGNQDVQEAAQVKAFNAWLMGDTSPETKATLAPLRYKAALNEGTASQGGYLAPTIYANELLLPLFNESYLRSAGSRIIPMTSDALQWPKLTASSAAVLTSEAASYNESEPTFGVVNFAPYKFTKEVKASDEMVADSRFDVWNEVILPDITQAFAEAENSYFTTGTGSAQPEGIVANTPVGVTLPTGQTTTIASADSIFDLMFSVDYKYRARPNSAFMASDTAIKIIRKLKDGQNRYLLSDNDNNLMTAPTMTILGTPIKTNNSMAVPAANAVTVIYGDFEYFYIGDRQGIQVKVLNELFAANGQVGWAVFKRVDSHNMLPAAFAALKQSAT